MLLKELSRLSSQHRTLYCYLVLSIWIFLLIAGMYKYISSTDINNSFLNGKHLYAQANNREENIKIKKFHQDCNPPENIVLGDEGGNLDGWMLQGVLLLIRHGDRGPMAHVRTISTVNCGYEGDSLLNKYKIFLSNSTTSTSAAPGHSAWMRTGPFHGFPLLPFSAKACLLGQLTHRGVAQLLHVGDILKQAYGYQLNLISRPQVVPPPPKPPGTNNTSDYTAASFSVLSDEIIVYATRYRRTFQSAMALMFSFIPVERWTSLTVRESHSLSFCFSECACPQAEILKKISTKDNIHTLAQHPAVGAVVQWIGTTLLQNPTGQMQPLEVRDAILSLICHNSPFPCRHPTHLVPQNIAKLSTAPHAITTDADASDVINIDQDNDIAPLIGQNTIEPDDPPPDSELDGCIESSHVSALLSYTQWQGLKELRSINNRRSGLLRAYGLIRSIVNYMLKMISGDKLKFVLYSGHDKTLQYMCAALGINWDNPFIPYASRMAFEVYKSDKDMQYYFRLVYNGHDITRQIDICEGGKSLRVNRGTRGNKADLCPIENIIRFIHDDYFIPLNATNYKDACNPFK